MKSEGTVEMADGVRIPYRLDGSTEADAPLLVLLNPSLVDLSFWDEVVAEFSVKAALNKYRILRFNNRGRTTHNRARPLSLDILSEDVVALLDHLGVQKAAAVVGVSLGALTVVNLAVKHPERAAFIMPCDLYPESPPNQAKIWNARVDVARQDKKAPTGAGGRRIIGSDLAEVTVTRWLSPASLNGGLEKSKIQALKDMVYENELGGFEDIVQAISSYDMIRLSEGATVPAVFVAGADDEAAGQMKRLAQSYGKGVTELKIIKDAGHLPLWDQPKEFADVVAGFVLANADK